jgi:hypothetical protein
VFSETTKVLKRSSKKVMHKASGVASKPGKENHDEAGQNAPAKESAKQLSVLSLELFFSDYMFDSCF